MDAGQGDGAEPSSRTRWPDGVRAHAVELAFCACSVTVLTTTATLGVVNGDEGWYAVSARLAARGAIPYRDFSFTQAPLLLYILAPSQLLASGLMAARLTSVALSAAGLTMLAVCVRRRAGTGAVVAFAILLLASFPELSYWLSITKTYALTNACLALTLFALTSTGARQRWWPVATLAALGVALTRSTGILFAVLVVAYCVRTAGDKRTLRRILLSCLAVAIPVAIIGFGSVSRADWDLVSYHQLAWMGVSDHIATIMRRPFRYAIAWPTYALVVTLALLAIVADTRIRSWLRAHGELAVVGVGLVSFLLLSAVSGAFFPGEYAAPAIPPLLAIAVMILSRSMPAWATPRLRVAALGVVAVFTLSGTIPTDYLGHRGWTGAPSATRGIARCVVHNSRSGDRVLALALEEVVADAHRKPVAGATLGAFSYEDVTDRRARQLHLLNASLLLDLLRRRIPSVVVMTSTDRSVLTHAGYFSRTRLSRAPIDAAIDAGYRSVCSGTLVRQSPNKSVAVTVYSRRP